MYKKNYVVLLSAKTIVTILNSFLRTFFGKCAYIILPDRYIPWACRNRHANQDSLLYFPITFIIIIISNTSVLLAADKQLRAELDDCIE